jgi:hypothetical protein
MDGKMENPLAKKLRDQRDIKDLASGEAGLEAGFIAGGKAQAPAKLQELWNLLQEYIRSYEAQRAKSEPGLRCPGRPPRFECIAGHKFAAVFEGMMELKEYTLRVTVGYHASTRLSMDDAPEIHRSEWRYQAYADDESFWWRDRDDEQRHTGETVRDRAMEALETLILL